MNLFHVNEKVDKLEFFHKISICCPNYLKIYDNFETSEKEKINVIGKNIDQKRADQTCRPVLSQPITRSPFV
jgi:hypothetical protein